MASDTRNMLKWPLIIAAIVIVLRIILEQLGAPEGVSNIFGVAWLHLIVPFYLAHQISAAESGRPYQALFKNLSLYTVYARLMVMLTYWLAYALQWQSPRFLAGEQGGNVGEGISALQGYLVIPVRNAIVWIVMATIVGMALGSILLVIKRRANKATSADAT